MYWSNHSAKLDCFQIQEIVAYGLRMGTPEVLRYVIEESRITMVTEDAGNTGIKATPIVAMENEQKEESNISEHPDDCNCRSEVCTCFKDCEDPNCACFEDCEDPNSTCFADCEDPETIDGNYSFYLPKECKLILKEAKDRHLVKGPWMSLCGSSWDNIKMISLLKVRTSKSQFINLSLELEKIYQETFPNHLKPRLYLGEEKTTRQGIYISLQFAESSPCTLRTCRNKCKGVQEAPP